MLVLAISVLILEDVYRGVRLVAPDTERNTHISKFSCDVIVDGIEFLLVGRGALGHFNHLGANFWRYCRFCLFKCTPPAAHLLPTLECAYLDVGGRDFGRVIPILTLMIGSLPSVNPLAALFSNQGLKARTLYLEFPIFWDFYLEFLVKNDMLFIEIEV